MSFWFSSMLMRHSRQTLSGSPTDAGDNRARTEEPYFSSELLGLDQKDEFRSEVDLSTAELTDRHFSHDRAPMALGRCHPIVVGSFPVTDRHACARPPRGVPRVLDRLYYADSRPANVGVKVRPPTD